MGVSETYGGEASYQGEAATDVADTTTGHTTLHGNASFFSHLFSFDGGGAKESRTSSGGTAKRAMSQTAVWFRALKSLKLSSLFEGFTFTPNFKGFALLIGCAGWLFVVAWVKEHDQGPNKRVSNPARNFRTAQPADQAIVGGLRTAFPFGTAPTQAAYVQQPSHIAAGPGQAMSADFAGDERFGAPMEFVNYGNNITRFSPPPEPILPNIVQPMQMQQMQIPTQMQPSQPLGIQPNPMQSAPMYRTNDMNYPSAYNIQMNSVNGTWLKTIVTR